MAGGWRSSQFKLELIDVEFEDEDDGERKKDFSGNWGKRRDFSSSRECFGKIIYLYWYILLLKSEFE